MEEVYLCLKRLSTITITIAKFIVVGIKVVTTKEVDFGLKITATISFSIMEQVLMFMGDMNMGIIPDTFPTISQVGMVYCRVDLLIISLSKKFFTVTIEVIEVVTMEEVDFCLNIPATLTL